MNSQRSCNLVTSGDFKIIYLQLMRVGALLTRMSASQACSAHRSQKRALYPLDWESQVLVHCQVGSRTRTLVLQAFLTGIFLYYLFILVATNYSGFLKKIISVISLKHKFSFKMQICCSSSYNNNAVLKLSLWLTSLQGTIPPRWLATEILVLLLIPLDISE